MGIGKKGLEETLCLESASPAHNLTEQTCLRLIRRKEEEKDGRKKANQVFEPAKLDCLPLRCLITRRNSKANRENLRAKRRLIGFCVSLVRVLVSLTFSSTGYIPFDRARGNALRRVHAILKPCFIPAATKQEEGRRDVFAC